MCSACVFYGYIGFPRSCMGSSSIDREKMESLVLEVSAVHNFCLDDEFSRDASSFGCVSFVVG